MKTSSSIAIPAGQGPGARPSGAMEDRDLAQVVEMNLRGLQVVRDEAASTRPGLPAAVMALPADFAVECAPLMATAVLPGDLNGHRRT